MRCIFYLNHLIQRFLSPCLIWLSHCRPKSKKSTPNFEYDVHLGSIWNVAQICFSGNWGQNVFGVFFWFQPRTILMLFFEIQKKFPSNSFSIHTLLTAWIHFCQKLFSRSTSYKVWNGVILIIVTINRWYFWTWCIWSTK